MIEPRVLIEAGKKGADSASLALSTMIGRQVEVEVSEVESLPLDKLVDVIKGPQGYQIVAYSQIITGVPGAALLMVDYKDALNLVDIIEGKPVGETKILQEMDRSAVKEILNVLSNSHVTALAQLLGMTIIVSVPKLITPERIVQVIDYLAKQQEQRQGINGIIIFKTTLLVKELKCKVSLYIIFESELVELIKGQEEQDQQA